MLSIPWVQRSQISRSYFFPPSSSSGSFLSFPAALPLAFSPRTAGPIKFFGSSRTYEGGWRPFLQSRQPHHRAFRDALWWGRPSCSPGCGILISQPHSHHNGAEIHVAQFRSAGRGIPSIPAPLTPSNWQLRGAPTATSLYAESAPAVVHPALMLNTGPLPGWSPPPLHVAEVSPPSPSPPRECGLPTWTRSSCGAPPQGAPWPRRVPSNLPLQSELGRGGRS